MRGLDRRSRIGDLLTTQLGQLGGLIAISPPPRYMLKEIVRFIYNVYRLLHSADYREPYADNLSKELPRNPRVRRPEDFRTFSQAGRDLASLDLHYESADKSLPTGRSLIRITHQAPQEPHHMFNVAA